MKKFIFAIILSFAPFLIAQTYAQTASGKLAKNVIRRGTSVKGKIFLDIPAELHVNSGIPENEFMIPTTVKLSGNGIRVTKLKYPKGVDRKFEFTETPINVYEKRVEFDFTFFVPRSFRSKTVRIRAVVGFQPCSENICYPPKKETVNLTANIR